MKSKPQRWTMCHLPGELRRTTLPRALDAAIPFIISPRSYSLIRILQPVRVLHPYVLCLLFLTLWRVHLGQFRLGHMSSGIPPRRAIRNRAQSLVYGGCTLMCVPRVYPVRVLWVYPCACALEPPVTTACPEHARKGTTNSEVTPPQQAPGMRSTRQRKP